MASLLRTQLRLALVVLAALSACCSPGCRCSSSWCPGLEDVHVVGMPLPWVLLALRRSTRSCSLLGWLYVRRAERNETRVHRRGRAMTSPERAHRGRARLDRDAGDRCLRLAVLAHHQRLLRGLAQRAAGPQRQRDRRRVPLRRVVPRCRRTGARLRHRHALVPGRLDRRLPRPARPGRRAAAALRRLHAARLRRGAARVARRCGWCRRCSW